MKIYVTQYCLAHGIKEYDAEQTDIPGLMRVPDEKGGTHAWVHKPHWYDTLDKALAQAECMRNEKIDSLRRKISHLEKIKFV